MDLIEKVLKKHRNPVVAFSGGKDSTAVLDMVRKVDPDILGIFCNTGVEAKLDQTKLACAIDSEYFTPFALVMQENANVTLTKCTMRSDTNDERLVVLLRGCPRTNCA